MKQDCHEITLGRLNLSVEIIRSARKTIAIELYPHGRNVVRAPFGFSDEKILRFLFEKRAWIERKIAAMQKTEENKKAPPPKKLTAEELKILKESAARAAAERAAFFAPTIGVTVGKITIRHQRTRWGSCSAKGNLSFNCLLMLCPQSVLDYVVVHELCHRKELNHSLRFWQEVRRILPAFEVERRWLKENGGLLIGRLPE